MKETIIIAKITAIQDILIDIHELNIAVLEHKQKMNLNEILSIIRNHLDQARTDLIK
jgi:hypothetical protein